MKVMKFGGRSLASPARMQQVLNIIATNDEPVLIVLSALSGTSQSLREIGEALQHNRRSQAKTALRKLENFYNDFINTLLKTPKAKGEALVAIEDHFEFLRFATRLSYSDALSKDLLSQGEMLSTLLLSISMAESGIAHEVLPALDFMQADKYGEPLIGSIKVKLTQLLNKHTETKIFITQGSLCRNIRGEVDNLGKGGSDYTASSIAAAMSATLCEIWSDIPAMQNNDLSVIDSTANIENLSFDEAAELAYFGEKVLHPASVWPARHYSIPVKLRNIEQPHADGTLITNNAAGNGAKVIAARDGITVINVKSSRMLMAYGFLQKILEIFEKYHTSIDMVSTSEVAVSLTIDNAEQLPFIAKDLEAFGVVTVDANQTLVSIVGNEMLQSPNLMSHIFAALNDIPLQIISYGGSRHNVSMLMPTNFKVQALKALHNALFEG